MGCIMKNKLAEAIRDIEPDIIIVGPYATPERYLNNGYVVSRSNSKIKTYANGFILTDTGKRLMEITSEDGVVEFPKDSSYYFSSFKFKEIDFINADFSRVEEMRSMFFGCGQLKKIDLTTIDTSNVTTMKAIFQRCTRLEEVILDGEKPFKAESLLDATRMFKDCTHLKKIHIIFPECTKVKRLNQMFYGCKSLEECTFENFDFEEVLDTSGMFMNCRNLENAEIGMDSRLVVKMENMFSGCEKINIDNYPPFSICKYQDVDGMLENCWNISDVDFVYDEKNDISRLKRVFGEDIRIEVEMYGANMVKITRLTKKPSEKKRSIK